MIEKLKKRVASMSSLACVGLDPAFEKLPARFLQQEHPQFEFNKWIIQQTHQYVAAYKANTAFYEARGASGWRELEMTIEYLRREHADIFTICDAKRADIGSTNIGYVQGIFDHLGFDAVTVHPYLGKEALEPLLERSDKVVIILCHTSNPGANELQNLDVTSSSKSKHQLWEEVALKIASEWNKNKNCMLVMGATYPEELRRIRELVGDIPLLIPGIGAQGGDAQEVIKFGRGSSWPALLISSSRAIIFSENPSQAAQKLATVASV